MRLALRLLLLVLSLAVAVRPTAAAPLLTRNLYLPFLAFYAPPPLAAAPPAAWRGAISLDYASLFQVEDRAARETVVDVELARLALHLGRRLTPRWAVDGELPMIETSGGVLDDFISDWHRTFYLPDGGRASAPANRHLYRLRVAGKTLLDEEGASYGAGDVAATLTWLALPSPGARLAIRLGVKAPTAGPRLGPRGSGGWDLAAGAVAEAEEGVWATALHLGVVLPTGVAEVTTRPFATGLVEVAWRRLPTLPLTVAVAGQTSPYHTGVAVLDRPAVELRLGASHPLSATTAVELAFVEDLTHKTTPDFSLHLAMRWSR
ncbi:MAG: DUF3187 family protein [Deltaproteobacteria bacterium]|nr:DUF3187 family protein [Deltaproteobacteria bacterium]NCP96333.1 DUF3187 family protein [Deltaproteobacteria bacterium]NCS74287.1 DUF3187 family protein [Deltaproteobacteria bacterium]OIP66184.1 MAG: hypothetical protein AUK30_02915 [Nitrospirae bacterium CG2_30_70_394]